jgi:hypothetical protein
MQVLCHDVDYFDQYVHTTNERSSNTRDQALLTLAKGDDAGPRSHPMLSSNKTDESEATVVQ